MLCLGCGSDLVNKQADRRALLGHDDDTTSIIGVCAVILLKQRHKMSMFQKIVSIVLYAGHTSKQVS